MWRFRGFDISPTTPPFLADTTAELVNLGAIQLAHQTNFFLAKRPAPYTALTCPFSTLYSEIIDGNVDSS